MQSIFHLRDVIDVEILQEIQDKFAEATGFAAVTVDYQGKPVTNYSNFSRFCKLIRLNNRCREVCEQSDAHGGLEAARTGKPYIYRCHTGLVDFAAPIIVQGQFLGSIMAGQVLVEESKLLTLDNIVKKVAGWEQNQDILDAYNEIAVIPFDKIVAAAEMMFLVSNYIVEKGIISIVQQELHNKNIKLMEEMKARIELEKALKDSELKTLQSQINPHFLFNALNTIGRLALIEKADRTQETVFLLAEMLRYTLKKVNQMVTLEDEVLHIERYLKIQSIRFGSRIKSHIDIPDDAKDIKIPFMTLQPFIENSINHGLETKESGGVIRINGVVSETDLIIQICDDGIGISPNKLTLIMKNKNSDFSGKNTTGIGISNVHQRLIHYYGPDHGVYIESQPNKGTKVQLRIPKQ